ncbi:MAG: tetratricopeptide repeat protein, partial [Acidobacteriota bacterium]
EVGLDGDEGRGEEGVGFVEAPPAEPDVVGELLHFQGELREQQGRPDEARALFERALDIRTQVFGADGVLTEQTRAALRSLDGGAS